MAEFRHAARPCYGGFAFEKDGHVRSVMSSSCAGPGTSSCVFSYQQMVAFEPTSCLYITFRCLCLLIKRRYQLNLR